MLSINQNCDDPTPVVEGILVTSNKFGSFSPKVSSNFNKITIGASHNNMTKIDSKIINLIDKSDYTPIDNQISSPIN